MTRHGMGNQFTRRGFASSSWGVVDEECKRRTSNVCAVDEQINEHLGRGSLSIDHGRMSLINSHARRGVATSLRDVDEKCKQHTRARADLAGGSLSMNRAIMAGPPTRHGVASFPDAAIANELRAQSMSSMTKKARVPIIMPRNCRSFSNLSSVAKQQSPRNSMVTDMKDKIDPVASLPRDSAAMHAIDATSAFLPVELIVKKRDGKVLTDKETHWLIREYHANTGSIMDYQMSAFLMAVALKGMNEKEAVDMTNAMIGTGSKAVIRQKLYDVAVAEDMKAASPRPPPRPQTLIKAPALLRSPSAIAKFQSMGPIVDKHSTGGVGDKVSLIVAPLAASLGMVAPFVSGRGLGHTGGTVDKMESIPGVRTRMSAEDFYAQLHDVRCGVVAPYSSVSPVENRIYGLRDTSGSVESPALIASSIMSKKLAHSPDALLLDVKTGRGAFAQHLKDSVALARMMVLIGEIYGVKTRALITNMEQPLGCAVGNFLEVREALQVLRPQVVEGSSAAAASDLATPRCLEEVRELALSLVATMQCMSGMVMSFNEGYDNAKAKLDDGSAFEFFVRMVERQGGDSKVLMDPQRHLLENTYATVVISAQRGGRVRAIDAFKVGMASLALGSGRLHADDPIDPIAGLITHVKIGDEVKSGDKIFTAYVGKVDLLGQSPAKRLERGVKRAREAYALCEISKHYHADPLVLYVVDNKDIYTFDPQKVDIKGLLS